MKSKKRNRKGTTEIQLSMLATFDLWENIATCREIAKKNAKKAMEKHLGSTDWLIIRVGDKVKCSLCCNDVQECDCPGGPVVRHDHEMLRVGDIRQNIGNALTDLAEMGGFPDGTIIAAKIRKSVLKGEVGFKWIEDSTITPVTMSDIEDLVNWDCVTRTLEERNRHSERVSIFTKSGVLDEFLSEMGD